jgi:hypothetical protein
LIITLIDSRSATQSEEFRGSHATARAEMGPIPAGYFLFLTFTFSESEMAGLQAALSVTWARYSKVFAFSVSEKLP